jgi:hypothetical protein
MHSQAATTSTSSLCRTSRSTQELILCAYLAAVRPSNGHHLRWEEDVEPNLVLGENIHLAPTKIVSLEVRRISSPPSCWLVPKLTLIVPTRASRTRSTAKSSRRTRLSRSRRMSGGKASSCTSTAHGAACLLTESSRTQIDGPSNNSVQAVERGCRYGCDDPGAAGSVRPLWLCFQHDLCMSANLESSPQNEGAVRPLRLGLALHVERFGRSDWLVSLVPGPVYIVSVD